MKRLALSVLLAASAHHATADSRITAERITHKEATEVAKVIVQSYRTGYTQGVINTLNDCWDDAIKGASLDMAVMCIWGEHAATSLDRLAAQAERRGMHPRLTPSGSAAAMKAPIDTLAPTDSERQELAAALQNNAATIQGVIYAYARR